MVRRNLNILGSGAMVQRGKGFNVHGMDLKDCRAAVQDYCHAAGFLIITGDKIIADGTFLED